MSTVIEQLAIALRALRDEVERVGLKPGGKANGAHLASQASIALAAYDAQQAQPIDAAAALVHAYAHGKANGDHVDWEYVNEAYNLARAEVGEERCAEIEALYGDTT